MTPAHRKYLASETLVSIVINTLLSLFFGWVVFGRREVVHLWGPDGLAMDFAPQTFMVALMSTLVQGALTRRRVRPGKIASLAEKAVPLPQHLLLRSLLIALLALRAALTDSTTGATATC